MITGRMSDFRDRFKPTILDMYYFWIAKNDTVQSAYHFATEPISKQRDIELSQAVVVIYRYPDYQLINVDDFFEAEGTDDEKRVFLELYKRVDTSTITTAKPIVRKLREEMQGLVIVEVNLKVGMGTRYEDLSSIKIYTEDEAAAVSRAMAINSAG